MRVFDDIADSGVKGERRGVETDARAARETDGSEERQEDEEQVGQDGT